MRYDLLALPDPPLFVRLSEKPVSVNLPVLLVYESTEVPVLRPPSVKVYVFLHIVLLVSKVPVVHPKVFVASVIVYD